MNLRLPLSRITLAVALVGAAALSQTAHAGLLGGSGSLAA